ncbi:Ribosomal RNA small subunit methyltransferase E [Kingella potus]|uniref:Ribosomal RNA small subunit methyltransferase E n=1 Tax=Kingella potus TaxID=265175 RepID=A0A377QZU9_9NEIS|nr:16S rRNA (uracil(1498)-N(3))-methyltransferase [Kingella potus]STR00547.1 Ribosomal RNA small subunit methyltransferase E [Kingella potus]
MPRFFADTALCCGATVSLPDNVVRHLHVLRCRAGGEIVLFNGDGCEYSAVLARLDKRAAAAEILAQRPSENESPLAVTLVQAVSAGERMDFTLQKSVELGVCEIIPVVSTRSVVRLEGERAHRRVARWQDIVVSACEQSGRCMIPKVRPLLSYQEALAHLPDAGAKLLMSLNGRQSLRDIPPPQSVVLMAGPEGGWTAQEEAAAFAAGFAGFALGRRVLRTETAALAALAAMQTLWGDF